jgi:hypothetical protein
VEWFLPIRIAPAMPVTDEQRAQLERMAGNSTLPHRVVIQARGLIAAAEGVANEEIARRCGVTSDTARSWRSRFAEQGVPGVGKDTIAKIWAHHELKPWQVKTFKVSTDPDFEAKLVDVVGRYLNPPAWAVVFSIDEKTQCQALDRTQPSLPMTPGRAGR